MAWQSSLSKATLKKKTLMVTGLWETATPGHQRKALCSRSPGIFCTAGYIRWPAAHGVQSSSILRARMFLQVAFTKLLSNSLFLPPSSLEQSLTPWCSQLSATHLNALCLPTGTSLSFQRSMLTYIPSMQVRYWDSKHPQKQKELGDQHLVSLLITCCGSLYSGSMTTGCRTGFTAMSVRWNMTSLARWRPLRMTWSL